MLQPLHGSYHRRVWCFLLAISSLVSVGRSLDSINLDLEVLEQIDLQELGTPNLDRYQLEHDVTVDESCDYLITIKFKKHESEVADGTATNFQGACNVNNNANSPDGLPWHAHRRHWMQFPDYVFETTGFNHMSLYWRPCGLPPRGYRKPRYELNFYTVIPQYRKFWICQEFRSPSICRYNQSSAIGRGHFSIPRLERDPNFLANMPLRFQPDPVAPEAYQYEGLISYQEAWVPDTPEEWILPNFVMSSYDGDTVSWRALIPDSFVNSPGLNGNFAQTQFYVFQTMPRLPSAWNMTFEWRTKDITVLIQGSAGMCGESFEAAKQEQADQKRRERRNLRTEVET